MDSLDITLHEVVAGSDGTYDFDATVRYRLLGVDFLVLVEAKHHRHPIKREVAKCSKRLLAVPPPHDARAT